MENSSAVNQRPNLFNYATSELSQDAFIKWLIQWADPIYKGIDKNLHLTGIMLLNDLFRICGKPQITYDKVCVYRKQFEKIDILIEINKDEEDKRFAIIIEDKTNSSLRHTQLEYINKVIKGKKYNQDQILQIYFKTGFDFDENVYQFKKFLRKEFLTVLNQVKELKIENPIFIDYYNYLLAKDFKENNIIEKAKSNNSKDLSEVFKYLAGQWTFMKKIKDNICDPKLYLKNCRPGNDGIPIVQILGFGEKDNELFYWLKMYKSGLSFVMCQYRERNSDRLKLLIDCFNKAHLEKHRNLLMEKPHKSAKLEKQIGIINLTSDEQIQNFHKEFPMIHEEFVKKINEKISN